MYRDLAPPFGRAPILWQWRTMVVGPWHAEAEEDSKLECRAEPSLGSPLYFTWPRAGDPMGFAGGRRTGRHARFHQASRSRRPGRSDHVYTPAGHISAGAAGNG